MVRTLQSLTGLALAAVTTVGVAAGGSAAGGSAAATLSPTAAAAACAAVVPGASSELTAVESAPWEWPDFEFVGPAGDFVAGFPAAPLSYSGAFEDEAGATVNYDEWLYDLPGLGHAVTRMPWAASSLDAALIEAVVARGFTLPDACTAVSIPGVGTDDVAGLEFEGVADDGFGGLYYRGRVFSTADATFEVFSISGDSLPADGFVASVRPAAGLPPATDLSAIDLAGLYQPAESDFAVAFPADPDVLETEAPNADGELMPTQIYVLEDREPAMLVSRALLGSDSPTFDFDLGFEGMLVGAGVTDYQVNTVENFLLQGHLARRVEIYVALGSARGSLITMQVFAADRGVLYQVLVLGGGQFDMSDPDVAAFVNSFTVLEPPI